ncbi:hypothetical protein JG688_00017737 [Phytophthora aleatoria]|uniref:Uncharacterized protein n=1 Tax=Phytophthora aleatoria TaxID=2496075 RepID=A0A8J5ISA3_9STRA|nr:hypothetical protein JG688_00017737 [Phytophthora aleatoria]
MRTQCAQKRVLLLKRTCCRSRTSTACVFMRSWGGRACMHTQCGTMDLGLGRERLLLSDT